MNYRTLESLLILSGAIGLLWRAGAHASKCFFRPVMLVQPPGEESDPIAGHHFNDVNHWDTFTLGVRENAVITKLFDRKWVTVERE